MQSARLLCIPSKLQKLTGGTIHAPSQLIHPSSRSYKITTMISSRAPACRAGVSRRGAVSVAALHPVVERGLKHTAGIAVALGLALVRGLCCSCSRVSAAYFILPGYRVAVGMVGGRGGWDDLSGWRGSPSTARYSPETYVSWLNHPRLIPRTWMTVFHRSGQAPAPAFAVLPEGFSGPQPTELDSAFQSKLDKLQSLAIEAPPQVCNTSRPVLCMRHFPTSWKQPAVVITMGF